MADGMKIGEFVKGQVVKAKTAVKGQMVPSKDAQNKEKKDDKEGIGS